MNKVIAFPTLSKKYDPVAVVQKDLKNSSVSNGAKLRAIRAVAGMDSYDELSREDMMAMVNWFLDAFDFDVNENMET